MSILDAFFALYNVADRLNTENFIYEIQSKPALWDMFSPLFVDKGAKKSWVEVTGLFIKHEDEKFSNTITRCWKLWKKNIDDNIF